MHTFRQLYAANRLLRHGVAPDAVREVDFTTPDPSVSADAWWLVVEQQERSRVQSRVRARRDPGARRFVGTTENVRRLRLQPETSTDAATCGVMPVAGGSRITVVRSIA